VSFLIGCPIYEEGNVRPCRGLLKLHEAAGDRRLLGRASWRTSESIGRPRTVRVRLTATGRRLARRRGGVLATVSFRDTTANPPFAWTIPLRARR
jgi:hypothetical protein